MPVRQRRWLLGEPLSGSKRDPPPPPQALGGCAVSRCSEVGPGCSRAFGGVRRRSEVFGGVRRCSEAFGGVRRCSEVFGGVRRCSEVFGGVRRRSEVFGGVRRCSEVFGGVRRRSEAFGGVRRCSEVFGGVRRRSEAFGGVSDVFGRSSEEFCRRCATDVQHFGDPGRPRVCIGCGGEHPPDCTALGVNEPGSPAQNRPHPPFGSRPLTLTFGGC